MGVNKLTLASFLFWATTSCLADVGLVIRTFPGCDYFIADGPRGLYVLEWYGGHSPIEGEKIVGDISSYGMKTVFYGAGGSRGRVWVEDFLESVDGALEEISDHCS